MFIRFTWTAGDADGDPLTYSVLYYNGGGQWQLLAAGLTDASYDVQVDSLAGGNSAHFRVVASDGVNVGFDESAAVHVPKKAPFASIINPASGTVVIPGGLVVFQGAGVDLEDGAISDGSMVWTSSIDGALGAGPNLPVNTLSPGLHTVTLTVTDSDAQSASATVQVLVGVPAIVDVQPDTITPGGSPPEVAVTVVLPPGYPAGDLDLDSLRLSIGGQEITPTNAENLGDTDSDGLGEIRLTFDGAAVQDALPGGHGAVVATISGETKDGMAVEGSDSVNQVGPGDADCDGDADSVDALQALRHTAGLTVTGECLSAADIDCDGDVDSVDALGILRHTAGLPVNQPPGCEPLSASAQASAAPTFLPGTDGGGGLASAIQRLARHAWLGLPLVVPALVATGRAGRR